MSAEGNAPGAPGGALSAPVVLAVLVAALGYFVDIFDLLLFGLVRTRSLTEVLAPQIAELPARFAAELAACADQEARQRVLDIATASLLKEWGGWLDNVLQTTGLMLGGLVWGVLGDRRGRLSVLFGSILCYSVANLLNGFITDVRVDGPLGFLHAVGLGSAIRQYEVLRFLAGFGLAGELGAGITLVAELVKPQQRGIATTVVATVGILGAVVGYFVTRWTGWREAFWIGGALGLGLLVLRIGVVESGMFRKVQARHERGRGAFWLLAWPPERLGRYLGIVLAAVPIWFVVGTLTKYSDVLGMSMGMPASERPDPAAAIMWCYMGLAAGDFASGMVSQLLRSRRRAMLLFHAITVAGMVLYFTVAPGSRAVFYAVICLLGVASGYWAVFVTSAAEQFGTNLRATAATTAPNLVRWSAAGSFLLWTTLEKAMGGTALSGSSAVAWQAAAVTAAVVMGAALLGLSRVRETFGISLDYLEESP